MREVDRIADQLERAYNGDAWHGPSVRQALEGIDGRMAVLRPVPTAHTICELVLHLTSWTREISRRLRLGIAQDPEDGDWPRETVANDGEWQAKLGALDRANAELAAAIRALERDEQLDEVLGDTRDAALGSGVSKYLTLHGLVQHHIYHAGQISLLKRAL